MIKLEKTTRTWTVSKDDLEMFLNSDHFNRDKFVSQTDKGDVWEIVTERVWE